MNSLYAGPVIMVTIGACDAEVGHLLARQDQVLRVAGDVDPDRGLAALIFDSDAEWSSVPTG